MHKVYASLQILVQKFTKKTTHLCMGHSHTTNGADIGNEWGRLATGA